MCRKLFSAVIAIHLGVAGVGDAQQARPEGRETSSGVQQGSLATPVVSVTGAFFALSVADIEASEQWYREKLGLSVIMRVPRTDATKSAATVLQGGGLTVELVKHGDAVALGSVRPSAGGALFVHGIFKVGVVADNYEAALAGIRSRGIPIAIGPFPARDDQPANFIIRDNAGNYIQIFGKR